MTIKRCREHDISKNLFAKINLSSINVKIYIINLEIRCIDFEVRYLILPILTRSRKFNVAFYNILGNRLK